MGRLNQEELYRNSDFSGIPDLLRITFNRGYDRVVQRMVEIEALQAELLEKYAYLLMRLDELERQKERE